MSDPGEEGTRQIYPNLVPVKYLRKVPKATVTLCKAGVVLLLRTCLFEIQMVYKYLSHKKWALGERS